CERLTLGSKPGNDVSCIHSELDDLERDAAADRLLLLGHIDHAATTLADLLKQFVTAHLVALFFSKRNGRRGCPPQHRSSGDFQKSARLLGGVEQGFNTTAQRPVVPARL